MLSALPNWLISRRCETCWTINHICSKLLILELCYCLHNIESDFFFGWTLWPSVPSIHPSTFDGLIMELIWLVLLSSIGPLCRSPHAITAKFSINVMLLHAILCVPVHVIDFKTLYSSPIYQLLRCTGRPS